MLVDQVRPASSASDAGAVSPDRIPHSVRLRWPDVARGCCIVLVVLWHVVLKQYQQLEWPGSPPFSALWGTLVEQFLPLRMPLFFTVSGLFAAAAVQRSWPDLLRSRIGRFALLYVLWVLVQTALFAAMPDFPTPRATDVPQLLRDLTISPTNLWYLLALAVYFTVAKVTRRVPTPLLLGAALLLSAVAAADLLPNENNRWQVLQNLVFFLAAARLAPQVHRLAESTSRLRAWLLVGGCVVATAGMDALGAQHWFGVRPLVSLLAAAAGVVLTAAIARRLRRTGSILAMLGTRTLAIYVLHLPLLGLLSVALAGPLRAAAPHSIVLAAVDPVLVTVATIALSLLAARLLRSVGLGLLLDPLGRSRGLRLRRS